MLVARRRVVRTVAGLGGLAILGVLSVILIISPLRATFWEQLTGETPEAKIAAYTRAIARGDEEGALRAWELPEGDYYAREGRLARLTERRLSVTQELTALGVASDFTIIDIEWWRTCCEPGLATEPRNAGGARVRAQLRTREGSTESYVFDVFNRDGAYWGAAQNYPPRQWALRDVYREGGQPLFWQFGRN